MKQYCRATIDMHTGTIIGLVTSDGPLSQSEIVPVTSEGGRYQEVDFEVDHAEGRLLMAEELRLHALKVDRGDILLDAAPSNTVLSRMNDRGDPITRANERKEMR